MQITYLSSANLRSFVNSFRVGNKIENLSATNPAFIGTVYKFPYLVTYITVA